MPTIDDLYNSWMRDTLIKTFGIPENLLNDEMKSPPKPMTLYDILEVPTNAKPNDIKASYRKLARKHHPDTGDGNTDAWLKIQKAYGTLADEEQRKRYDVARKVLAQKLSSPDEDTAFWNSSWKPASQWKSPKFSTGSQPIRQTRQPNVPFRIGQRIPQIGGVVSQISVNVPSPIYTAGRLQIGTYGPYQYEVSVDATLHPYGLSANDLMSPDSWYDWLRLDKNQFSIVRIDSQFSTNVPYGQVASLGATFVLDIREL